MKLLSIVVLSIALLSVACEDPSANKPQAKTSDPVANSDNGTSQNTSDDNASSNNSADPAKGEKLPISPENSKVEFTGSKVTGKHEGGFKAFSGTIDLVDGKVENSGVNVEIDMKSVFTDADGLTEHLKTGDFFEIEKHPKSTFESTKIVSDPAGGENTYTVTGNLEMRGIKKSVTFPAKIVVGDENVNVDAEFSINRKDFGIVYAGKADDLIRDGVVIRLNLKSPRKK
ncbi:MAG: YceI family protein [Acidobacteria bacterium]|nr:YceI family protein [Acidobacteriota bacterium]